MSLFEVGRLCLKLAGRDAGQKCVVVEKIDSLYVIVDGLTRRRKVNTRHLEPLAQTITLKAKADHQEVKKVFAELGLELSDKKSKPAKERAKKQKKRKEKATEEKKASKKAAPKKGKTTEEKVIPAEQEGVAEQNVPTN